MHSDFENVKAFLKHKYKDDDLCEFIFAQVTALNEMFTFIHKENPTLFARMDSHCDGFRYLAHSVIKIQQENEEHHMQHYPTWTCKDCALKCGGVVKPEHISCWHLDVCDICDKECLVTQPRDFGYPPNFPKKKVTK